MQLSSCLSFCFNSHLRVGGVIFVFWFFNLRLVSILTSAWEVSGMHARARRTGRVSILTSAWEVSAMVFGSRVNVLVSILTSAWEVSLKFPPVPFPAPCFNSHLRVGGVRGACR